MSIPSSMPSGESTRVTPTGSKAPKVEKKRMDRASLSELGKNVKIDKGTAKGVRFRLSPDAFNVALKEGTRRFSSFVKGTIKKQKPSKIVNKCLLLKKSKGVKKLRRQLGKLETKSNELSRELGVKTKAAIEQNKTLATAKEILETIGQIEDHMASSKASAKSLKGSLKRLQNNLNEAFNKLESGQEEMTKDIQVKEETKGFSGNVQSTFLSAHKQVIDSIKDSVAAVTKGQATMDRLLEESGIDSNKSIEVGGAEMPLGEFISTVANMLNGNAEELNDYKDNLDAAIIRIGRDKQERGQKVDELSVVQVLIRPINNSAINSALAKHMDKLLDGFCGKCIVDAQRLDGEGSNRLGKYEIARNNMIHERLPDAFKDFVKDRLEVNDALVKAYRNQQPDPKLIADYMQKASEFLDKYGPLAAEYQQQLKAIRDAPDLPPYVSPFDQNKEVEQKNPEIIEVLEQYGDKPTWE